MRHQRFHAPHLWFSGIWRSERSFRACAVESADLGHLAELCDRAGGPDREIDMRIALAISSSLPLLSRRGAEAHDRSSARAPRYSASTAAALTLVPDSHWIEYNPRAAGRVEIHGPGGTVEIGWGRNRHFPLAASAAALRALACLHARTAAAAADACPQRREAIALAPISDKEARHAACDFS